MGAPVNTGYASRFGRWCASWTPTNIAKSYVEEDLRTLNAVDPSGGLAYYIQHLADVSPDLTQYIKENLPNGTGWFANWLMANNEKEIQKGIFLHVAARLVKLYIPNDRNLSLDQIILAITRGITTSAQNRMVADNRNGRFYELAQEILETFPLIGNVNPFVVSLASYLKDIHDALTAPLDYDAKDKLVASFVTLNDKFIKFAKSEIKTFPQDKVKEDYQPVFHAIAPALVDDPFFAFIWTNLNKRLPSLINLEVVHLRSLLGAENYEDLIVKLKADFKNIYAAARRNEANEIDAKLLAETLVTRYFSPILESKHIPAFLRPWVKNKVVDLASKKLEDHKNDVAAFFNPAPAAPAPAPVAAPVDPLHRPPLLQLPVVPAAPPAAEPSFLDKYSPQGIARAYRLANEQYLRELIRSDKLIDLVKNLSHQVPDLTIYAPEFVRTMINGSAKELQEGIFVHLVVSLCKTIYKDKPNPADEIQVSVDIFDHLTRAFKTTFDKADTTRDLKVDDFRGLADELIKSLLPEFGDIPFAIDPVAKLLHEFYLLSRVAPVAPVKDPLNDTVSNYNQKVIAFVKAQVLDLQNSETIINIDPALKPIVDVLIGNFSRNPLFAGIKKFLIDQLPSITQMELTHLKTLLNAQTNRELFIKLLSDFGDVWRVNRDNPDVLVSTILERYFAPILNSHLIPGTLKPFILPLIKEKLKFYLDKYRATIEATLQAFDVEKDLLLNDPLAHYSAEVRKVTKALTREFYENAAKHLPVEVSKEFGESIMEEALYHVFGRLQLKFRANSFKELESHILAYTHQKLSVLVRSAEIDESIYLRLSDELLNDVAPAINASNYIVRAKLADYLKTIIEITSIREPKDLGFGELNKEMKPFLYSIVDFILRRSLEKPRDVIPELVLYPKDLNNPDTLKIARETLYKHLAVGFSQFFGNGKLHQGLSAILDMFSKYGKDKLKISNEFALWVGAFRFNADEAAGISEEAGSKFLDTILEKVPKSKQPYFNDLLNHWSQTNKVNKALLCRHLSLDLNLDRAIVDLLPKLDMLERIDKEMGAAVMTALLPTISRAKYPDLFDNLADTLAPSLLRMMDTLPEKLSQFGAQDIESLEKSQIHPAATILSKISALTDSISESAEESQFAIGKKLAAFFVEIGASHLIVNNKGDIDLLIATLAQHNFLKFTDDQLNEYAKDLIKQLCPVLEAFSPGSEEMVVKLLKIAKAKIPSNDRKEAKASIRAILFDPNNRTDHHIYDVDRYIEQIDKAVYAFAGLILKWTRAYGGSNLPESLKQLVKVEGSLLEHSQEVIAAILMKALLNFLRKVEQVNPGPKGTLMGRALYVLFDTIVKKLPDIKEGNFKDLSEALWGLFDLDKEVPFDLSYVRNEFLPKQLMEYSQSIRTYIDEMGKNSKELKDLFNSNALPELLKVLGTVWLRDFIPNFLTENTDELAEVLLSEINSFFETAVLQEGDSSFIAESIRELIKSRDGSAMKSVYAFAGLYASAYMLKYFNNLFKKKKIDGLAQEIARKVISKVSVYYSKVVEAKGRRPHAHLLSPEELKGGLGELFSDGMPINGDELSESQKTFYGKLTDALTKAGDADKAESVPMIDFLQGPIHNLITNKLLPSTLSSIIKAVGSRKTINKGLIKLLETVTQKLESDWDVLENAFHNTLCNIDDLNYKLNGKHEVNELKEIVKEAKTKYGADPEKVMEILKLVDEAVKHEEGATLGDLKKAIEDKIAPLKKLVENQDEDLVEDLAKLRDAIIHLVPKKFVADLLKIEAFNDMTSSQLAVLYNRLVNGLKFEDWINLGAEVLMPTLVPNGVYANNHFGPIDPEKPLAADLKEVVYTDEEAKADEKLIVDGFAEVSIDGTNKAIIHTIKSYIRDLSMKIGQKLIKWFGVRVIPLRRAYTAVVDAISFILTPILYVISHISAPVIKFIERKVARREIEPHIRGFHADYNQNVILLIVEDLVTLLTNGKADDKENLQNSNARV